MQHTRYAFTVLISLTLASACTTGFKKKQVDGEASPAASETSGEVADEQGPDTSGIELECPGTAEQKTRRPYKKHKNRVQVYCDQAGTPHGPAKDLYESGRVWREGEFVSGKKTGTWKGYWNNEKHSKAGESEWEDGKRHGPYQNWFANGKRELRGRYEHGHKTGEWAKYNKKGQLIWKGSFKDGKRDGEWSFYEKGKMTAITTFADGKKSGPGQRFHPDGMTVKSEGTWENGLRVGEWKQYDDQGMPLESEKCEPSCKN